MKIMWREIAWMGIMSVAVSPSSTCAISNLRYSKGLMIYCR